MGKASACRTQMAAGQTAKHKPLQGTDLPCRPTENGAAIGRSKAPNGRQEGPFIRRPGPAKAHRGMQNGPDRLTERPKRQRKTARTAATYGRNGKAGALFVNICYARGSPPFYLARAAGAFFRQF